MEEVTRIRSLCELNIAKYNGEAKRLSHKERDENHLSKQLDTKNPDLDCKPGSGPRPPDSPSTTTPAAPAVGPPAP